MVPRAKHCTAECQLLAVGWNGQSGEDGCLQAWLTSPLEALSGPCEKWPAEPDYLFQGLPLMNSKDILCWANAYFSLLGYVASIA